MSKLNITLIVLGIILLIGGATALTCLDRVENHELGYTFDLRTGKIEVLPRQGYFFTPPFVIKVHRIDLRPTQVCINANSRVLNCKLVKFNPDGIQEFVSWHGRGDYEIDINRGITTKFEDILMSYAYDESDKKYPFITIVKEFGKESINELDSLTQ